MGRMYTVPLDNLSVTTDADQDIFVLANGAGHVSILHTFYLESNLTTDERVRLRLMRRSTAGSGGSAATEVPLAATNTVTAGGAITTLVTTPGTPGAILQGFQWSTLAPLLYLPTPETRIVVAPSGIIALNLQSAVGATRTWSGYVTWEEIG